MGRFLRRAWALLHRGSLERQLEEDMAAHREMMPAERRRYFGSDLRLREEAADHWGWTWLDHLRQDLGYGLRQLRRSPGFTATAIGVLALGIGVNLAEAHLFEALLHRLHVRDLDSLCHFYRFDPRDVASRVSLPEIDFYRRNNTVLSALIAETNLSSPLYMAEDTARLKCSLVSGNYFGELGVAPLYGRLLDEQDDRPGAAPTAVLAYDYWQSRFGGDASVMRTGVRINGKPVAVVGIVPPQFGGLDWHPEVWVADFQQEYLTGHALQPNDFSVRASSMYGRLKPGVSREAAQEHFRVLTAELSKQQPLYVDRSEWLKVEPAQARRILHPAEVLLLSTFILLVLMVLFSACANLGNMLLARGLARRHEIEVRLAVGASGLRVMRQLMTENLLLAALGTLAALIVGRASAGLLLRMVGAPSDLILTTDWRVVLAGVALGVAAMLAFGLAPAMQSVRGGPKATRARKILVSVQVAASCALLILSSFFTRAMERSFLGVVAFDYSRMALVDPMLYLHQESPASAREEALEIAARLRGTPGVEGASLSTNPPEMRGHVVHLGGRQLAIDEVDGTYFATMRMALLAGHIFGPDEPDAVVIGESAARQLWPNESPLGKRLTIEQRSHTVAGVVKDSGLSQAWTPEAVEVYLPVSDQHAANATLVVRTARDAAQMAGALRPAATIVGANVVVYTFRGLIEQRFTAVRKMLRVVGSLAGVASLLALLGIFGLLAFTVVQRTREIGVRMALGARGRDILGIVLGQYAVPFGAGSLCGMALAGASAAVIRRIVFGFMPFDVWSFGAGLALFGAVALAASVAPARRALRVDPASALRWE